MIPLSLRFQAFESYKNEAVIDFARLDSLFLIRGETGAGKTAVLDAVMYSLYGETSGGERIDVRCADIGAEKLPTETEFIFSVRDCKYKFTRTIKPAPRSNRLDEKQDCFFMDSAGMWIPYFENPKKIFVREKAEELLGLTSEQFRQIVILPQGRFEKLLTSDSSEKEKLLSAIFNTEKYSRISAELYAKADEEKKRLAAVKAGIDAVLKNEHADNTDALEKIVSDKKAELSVKLEERKNAQLLCKKLADELKEKELVLLNFNELDRAKKTLSEYILEENEIVQLKNQLERSKLSAKIIPLFNECADLKKSADERCKAAEKIRLEKSKLSELLVKIDENGVKLTAEKELAELKRAELSRLISLKEVYEKASPAKADWEKKQKLSIQFEKNLSNITNSIADTEKKLAELTAERENILTEFTPKISTLATRKKELEDGKKAAENVKRYTDLLNQIQTDVNSLDKGIIQLENDTALKQMEYDTVYKKHILMLSASIANSLKDGKPCPVCGSVHHPAPAKTAEAVPVQQLDELKNILDEMRKKKADMLAERAKQAGRIESGKEKLDEQKSIFEASQYTAKELAFVTAEYDNAVRKNSALPEINSSISKLSANKASLEEQRKKTAEEYDFAKNQLAQAKFLLDSLSEKLDKSISDSNALNARTEALGNDLAEFEKKCDDYDRLKAETEKSVTIAETALFQALEEQKNADKAYERKKNQLDYALNENGFADEKEMLSASLSDSRTAEMENIIGDYAVKLASLNDKITVLTKALDAMVRPDINALKEQLAEKESIYQQLINITAVLESDCKRLDTLAADCRKKHTAYIAEKERNDRQLSFALMMRGDRGISFARYVLGVMLSVVTAEANRLLADVLGGQFRLYRKADGDARAKQGLDLEAESALSSQTVRYSVKNLSGGEKFLVSLALSMGLSSAAQKLSGGISVDAMFIDEGFGSLDPQALREAVDVLCSIKGSRRTVGIISHVRELREIIPSSVEVIKDSNGSRLSIIS